MDTPREQSITVIIGEYAAWKNQLKGGNFDKTKGDYFQTISLSGWSKDQDRGVKTGGRLGGCRHQ